MNRGFVTVLAAIAIMAVMATSFIAGITIGHQGSHQYTINGAEVPADLHQPLDDLWTAYQRLNTDSYWRPFDHKALIYGAVSGMLSNCCLPQDTHSSFLEPVNSQAVSKALNGGVYGIGAEVQMTGGGLLITAPYFNSPATRAGLQPGDLITAVNGHSIRGLDSTRAVNLIHGSADTIVRLTIQRSGVSKPFVVAVTRAAIPTVIVSNNGPVGYLQFSEFGSNTASEVHGAISRLLNEHVKHLVVDLRNNGGGYVFAAKAIASEFLPKGAVIYWDRSNLEGHKYSDVATSVTDPGIAQHLTVVVLVNGYTASAAEILTAALRENGRAHVVGTTTYGKGSEQEDLTLPDGSGLRITTALWLTPKKHEVNSTGIQPDITVEPGSGTQDNQLQRAIQLAVSGR
jgi:carboxyl-terminal processing protease